MKTRTPCGLLAAATLALFAGACTDTPTEGPALRAPGGVTARATTASGPALVSTSVRYRDRGGKPATGRSGNAVLNALALLDREGTTSLYLTTRHATEWWRNGYIGRAQVKASSADGRHRFTRNLNGFDGGDPDVVVPFGTFPPELRFRGLGGGDRLRVQANVGGLDGERTDVVTVTESVKRLPELRVEMAAPAQVETGTPVNILAVVSERNGDMGVYAVCSLYVAGELVDRADGVWIDAGDAVTCAMTWSFLNPGSYPLEVRVSTDQREWDAGNNADSAVVTVHGESPRFYTSASFTQTTGVDSMRLDQSWRDGSSGLAGESVQEEVNAYSQQYASMYAFMPAQIPGSLDVRASMSTGGRVVTSAGFMQTSSGTDPLCVGEYDGRAMLYLCTFNYDGVGQTSINYSWFAGTVTYHSRQYSRMWDTLTGQDLSVYHWNYDYGWGDGLVPLGDDWSFEVKMGSPGGEQVAAAALRLEPQAPEEHVEPYACTTYEETYWNYTSTVCRGSSSRVRRILGF